MRFALPMRLLSATLALSCVCVAQPDRKPMVVVISLDAFAAESLKDPNLPAPTLHWMMKTGAYAAAMQPINPTVTWPNHTAIITGVNASKHHVLVNGLIQGQRGTDDPKIQFAAPKKVLVAVPTVYDAAHEAGLTTAEVDWVAITHPGTIDWSFPERADEGLIVDDLVKDGSMTKDQVAHFFKPSQAWRDRIYTLAAVDILKKHHPNLSLFHLLALDGIEHKTGYGNDAGRNTIAFLDDRVKDIVDAVREAGDLDRTTFIIVSDHGQESTHYVMHPNALLRDSESKPGGQTYAIPEGGYALLYQQHATPESTEALAKVFRGQKGVRAVLTPEQAAKDGWPTPAQTNQAPDLLLYAQDDYRFGDGDKEPFVTTALEAGAHGFPNTVPLMQAIFIASGRGIKAEGKIPAIPNIDVAPTIAKLLGISFTGIDGKPLTAILK
jgi:predicted AlkP superfamily pyrophosphatase or phosphodiesterase